MRIILTRPRRDSEALAERLRRLGHSCCITPLLRIRAHPVKVRSSVNAWILTSANAARAFTGTAEQLARPAYAVGSATEAAARAAGFTNVRAGVGDALDLFDMLRAEVPVTEDPLVYLRGRDVRTDLGKLLAYDGYQFEEYTVYSANPVPQFPVRAAREIEHGRADAITFLSARTARIFCDLLPANLHAKLNTMTVFTLSKNVTAELDGLTFKRINAAPEPNVESLLEQIRHLFNT